MSNSDIADLIKLFADLSELHGGNPFKIKSFSSAAFRIDKMPVPLTGKTIQELEQIEGIGKSLAVKIDEINTSGSFAELNELIGETPEGIRQMMRIKGIGPKKVSYLWKEVGIENIGDLLYACHENRIAQAKGFGLKTQQHIISQIEFLFASADKFHYAVLEPLAAELLNKIKEVSNPLKISFSNALRRKCEILDGIDMVAAYTDPEEGKQALLQSSLITVPVLKGNVLEGRIRETVPVRLCISDRKNFAADLFEQTGSDEHIRQLINLPDTGTCETEAEIYAGCGLPFIEPELREGRDEIDKAKQNQLPALIELPDLKGILHNHSTYSDGLNTLEEMAVYCKELGYEYLGICDHSKSAFYARGMKEDQILKQHDEIEKLNEKLFPFRIFKGIESDILNDGSLDYTDDVLKTFDFIVSSVHSNLKMTEEKAMMRLLRAIENPYTTILGHPTGRLLLMREGYPVDHRKIIDACAANGVTIEINANPYRLDLDWRWIGYAMDKGVKLSINPDAHEREGYHDMYFGVCAARKGGLTAEMCLNAMDLSGISDFFQKRNR